MLLNESAQYQEVFTVPVVLPKPCLTYCSHSIRFGPVCETGVYELCKKLRQYSANGYTPVIARHTGVARF